MSRIYRRFAPAEDEMIRAGQLSVAKVASTLQRHRMSVHRRAVKLGLKGAGQDWRARK